jgi:histone H2A
MRNKNKQINKQTNGAKRKGSISRSKRSGLAFPVGRVHRHLRERRNTPRVGALAPVYLAAVIEYLTSEVLELAGDAAAAAGKKRVSPRHMQLAIMNDEALNRLLGGISIVGGGLIPGVNAICIQN